MSLLKNYNKALVKSSSLIESVIAIAVMAICVLSATIIYNQVLSSSYNVAFQKAKYRMNSLKIETREKGLYADATYEGPGYKIYKKVEEHNANKNIKEISFEIRAHDKKEKFTYLILDETP